MMKMTIDNWKTLQFCMERIKEAKIEDIAVEATLVFSNESAQRILAEKNDSEKLIEEGNGHKKKLQADALRDKLKKIRSEEEANPREEIQQETEISKEEHRKRRKNGETKKKILAYMEQKYSTGEPVTVLELVSQIDVTRNQIARDLRVLREEGKITRIGYGKYELFEETETEKTEEIPEEIKKLKVLYQKTDYQKVMDYIYTKTYFQVDGVRKLFIMEERMVVDIIRLSIKAGFIEEIEISGETTKYKVNPLARVWFVMMRSKRTNLKAISIDTRMHDFTSSQIEKILEEGLEKGIILLNEKRQTYSVA